MEGVCNAVLGRTLELAIPIIAPIIPVIFVIIMLKLKKPVGLLVACGVLFIANFQGYSWLHVVLHLTGRQLVQNIGYFSTVIIITIGSTILCIVGIIKGSILLHEAGKCIISDKKETE